MRSVLWRNMSIALGLTLAASVAVNVRTYSMVREYYRELNEVRLNPIGARNFDREPVVPSGRAIAVLFGDSRAAQWQPLPDVPDLTFVNRGIGSQTSEQALLRFDEHVAPLRPEVVIIEIGVNDLKAVGMLPQRRSEIVSALKANITEMLRRARVLGAHVVLMTVIPPGNLPLERRLVWSDEIDVALVEVNQWIRSQATDGVVVFDADPILTGPDGTTKQRYQRDFLHLNGEGYEHLSAGLAPLL